MVLIYVSLGTVLTFIRFVAFCIEEVWAAYYDLRKGFRYDRFKAVSTEPDQGKNTLRSIV